MFLPASGVAGSPWCPFPCRHITPICTCVITFFLFVFFSPLCKDTSPTGLKAHSNPVRLYVNLMTSAMLYQVKADQKKKKRGLNLLLDGIKLTVESTKFSKEWLVFYRRMTHKCIRMRAPKEKS